MVVFVISCVYVVKFAASMAFARAVERRMVSVSPEWDRDSGMMPCPPSQSVIALTLSRFGDANCATYDHILPSSSVESWK